MHHEVQFMDLSHCSTHTHPIIFFLMLMAVSFMIFIKQSTVQCVVTWAHFRQWIVIQWSSSFAELYCFDQFRSETALLQERQHYCCLVCLQRDRWHFGINDGFRRPRSVLLDINYVYNNLMNLLTKTCGGLFYYQQNRHYKKQISIQIDNKLKFEF